MPFILSEYFHKKTGEGYHVGLLTKLVLVFKIMRNTRKIVTASHFFEHLVMATRILNIPKSVEGSVVECGSYKGGSTANLPLICGITNRQLEVFDSFEALPEPSKHDEAHVILDLKETHTYSKGAWCGSLEEVKRNVSKYGRIDVCNFHVGYFDSTLPGFRKKCVFVFSDVDLRDSLVACVKYLWPLLQDGCSLYIHEANHLNLASLFFDKEWWRSNCNCDAPGLIGAGSGLGLVPSSGGFKSALGYTVKNPKVQVVDEVSQMRV